MCSLLRSCSFSCCMFKFRDMTSTLYYFMLFSYFSYSMWSGALESSGLLLSYPTISLAYNIINILMNAFQQPNTKTNY